MTKSTIPERSGSQHILRDKTVRVCTYDNPVTAMRECWRDGQLQAAYTAKLYALKKWPVGPAAHHFGANIGDWKEGQLVGDRAAMGDKAPPEHPVQLSFDFLGKPHDS